MQGELSSEARRLLEDVRDGVPSFDEPAFYWLCRHVRSEPAARSLLILPEETTLPLKHLLEQPAGFRGRAVLVEGVLRSSYAYEVANRADAGRLLQCELSDVRTGAICTVVCTDADASLPIGMTVRAKGYFLKVRSFRTRSGGNGAGPLLVARRLEPVPSATADSARPGHAEPPHWPWGMVGLAILAPAWVLLRRWLARGAGATAYGRRSPRFDDLSTEVGRSARQDIADDVGWLLPDEGARDEAGD